MRFNNGKSLSSNTREDKEVLIRISDSFGHKMVVRENGQETQVNIITPEELAKIPMGTGLVMLNRKDPLYVKFASIENYEFYWNWLRTNLVKSKNLKNIKGTKKIKKATSEEIAEVSKIMNQIYTPEDKIPLIENFINSFGEKLKEKALNIIPIFIKSLFSDDIDLEIKTIIKKLDTDFLVDINQNEEISDELFSSEYLKHFSQSMISNSKLFANEFQSLITIINQEFSNYVKAEEIYLIWDLFFNNIKNTSKNDFKDIIGNILKEGDELIDSLIDLSSEINNIDISNNTNELPYESISEATSLIEKTSQNKITISSEIIEIQKLIFEKSSMISILQNIKSGSFEFLKPVFKEQIINIFNALIPKNKEEKIKLINEIIKECKIEKLSLIKDIEVSYKLIFGQYKKIQEINSQYPISKEEISKLENIIFNKIIKLLS